MRPPRRAFVVAIAAVPGAGKSTVAKCLADRIAGSTLVAYDRFQRVTRMSMADLAAWDEAGGDCNAFDLAPLEHELQQRQRSGASLVVFETPLGRSHRGTARFVDCLVWLDTPRDVALARALGKILEDHARDGIAAGDAQRWLASYLAAYRDLLWRLYRRQGDAAKLQADLVVSGLQAPGAIADRIASHLRDGGLILEAHPDVER